MKVGNSEQPWEFTHGSSDEFLLKMLEYGKPVEVSLVGVFDETGRGSRRDIPLPFHRDGDYSKDMAAKHSIDVVGLHCLRSGDATTLIKHGDKVHQYNLQEGHGIIFENQEVLHAREGEVGDRVLLRVWIERPA
jgi:hypothetical protein